MPDEELQALLEDRDRSKTYKNKHIYIQIQQKRLINLKKNHTYRHIVLNVKDQKSYQNRL